MVATALKADLIVLPYSWNVLHLASIYGLHQFIKAIPPYSEFKMKFILDHYGKTPLHYLISHKRINYTSINIMVKYICDYIEDCSKNGNTYEFQKIFVSLTPLFCFILLKTELKLKERFLNLCLTNSPTPYRMEVPDYGKPKLQNVLLKNSPEITPQAQEAIWDDGQEQVNFKTNFLLMDYNVTSIDMQNVIKSLIKQKNEEIFKTQMVAKLIDYLWKQTRVILEITFVTFSIFMIVFSVYVCLEDRHLPYEIFLLVFTGILFWAEILQMLHLKENYLKDPWNWLDITHLCLTTAFIVTRLCNTHDELARAWISSVLILMGYLRWVSYLRLFKPTSKSSFLAKNYI